MEKNSTENKIHSNKMRFNSTDWGWVAINIGMGIGAGIVFLPVQAGIVGLWIFLASIIISYPLLYLFHRLFVNTIIEAQICDDYTSVISEFLGKNWGIILGIIYFLMLIIWVFVYSTTIVNDSAAYLQNYKITTLSLSHNKFYSLMIIVFMTFLAFKSEKLLFHISKILVVFILLALVILGFLIIPNWAVSNIMPITSFWEMFKNTLITLPFAMTSILFLLSLSPMVIAIRGIHKSKYEARKKALKIMNTSFAILATVVFFFALSCTLTINHTQALEAFKNNTSFLTIIVKYIPGIFLHIIGIGIDIFAVMTSFFGVLLGFHEACQGLAINIFMRNTPKEQINMKILSKCTIVFIVFVAWFATIVDFPILYFTSICSPIFGVIGCFVPVLLVYRSDELYKYRGITSYIVIFTGILLVISPLLALISG